MFGKMYNFKRVYTAAILITVGFLWHYIPMFILGMQGMPRRYYDYLPKFAQGNFIAGLGGIVMVIGIGLMFYNLFISIKKGKDAPADPWGGTTLEWTIPSPPPVHNFTETPVVKDYPYDFSEIVAKQNIDKNE